MVRTQHVELLPGDRVSDDDRLGQRERVDHANDILGQARKLVPGRGRRRGAVSAPGDAIDAVLLGEHGGKVIEDVRGIS
jgi:hypothetical protein